MSPLGRFLELSVSSADIIESLTFFRDLGFTEQPIGEIWSHRYAVVTDGDVSLGLHGRTLDGPALTFTLPDLAKHARRMADRNFDFSFLKLDEDVFNEVGFVDPDGNPVAMLEARTFTPPDMDTPPSALGQFFEMTLPVRDGLRAARFWAPLAPKLEQHRDEPTTHFRFDAGGLPLGLSESARLRQASLCFKTHDADRLESVCTDAGVTLKPRPGFEGAAYSVTAPDGTTLYVFEQDFLGEGYEVDESDADGS